MSNPILAGAALAAIMLAAGPAGIAKAEHSCPPAPAGWYRQAEALVRSLLGLGGGRDGDRDVIAPPRDIDPQMVLTPAQPGGVLRVVPPPPAPR
jgi:hypothetical protein